VGRATPGVWDLITPQEAIAVREAGAAAALRRLLGGRVLSAANSELPVSADPLTRLWQAATLLREHRGDGHFAALAAAGIDGCEAVVLRCAKDISRDLMQPVRGTGSAPSAWPRSPTSYCRSPRPAPPLSLR
jgi:hypothetical protein